MSDNANNDDSLKTEEPTQRRLEEAREKGQVAKSQEVGHWFMILAFAVIIGLLAPQVASGLSESMASLIARAHEYPVDPGGLGRILGSLALEVFLVLALPLAVVVIAAVLSGFLQVGLIFTPEPLKPKLNKISLISGVQRLFSSRAIVEFVKGIGKLAIVAAVALLMVWPQREMIPLLPSLPMPDFLDLLGVLALRVILGVLAVMTVLAILDLTYQRFQHNKQLRMTKQEVRDEHKQAEGDPMIKARLRQLRAERARRRMLAAVPEADVVVTNPTHYAVALRYDPASMNAPKVTAKGVDKVAQRIRAAAEEHEVPLMEDPPLARALFDTVDLDSEVPPEHYKAVAEIIGYVMRLKGRMPRAAVPARARPGAGPGAGSGTGSGTGPGPGPAGRDSP